MRSGEFPVVLKNMICRGQLPVAGNQRSWVGLSDSQSSAAPARRRFGVDEQPSQRARKGSGSDIQDRVVWHFTLEWAIPRSPSETFHPTPMMQWMVKFHAMGRGKQPFLCDKMSGGNTEYPGKSGWISHTWQNHSPPQTRIWRDFWGPKGFHMRRMWWSAPLYGEKFDSNGDQLEGLFKEQFQTHPKS